jgi:hypothetical protein
MMLACQCFTAVLLLIYGILFLSGVYYFLSILVCRHENVGAEIRTLSVREFSASKQTTVLGHPLYSPDVSLSDLSLFPKMKETLRGRHFNCTDDRKNTTAALKAIAQNQV